MRFPVRTASRADWVGVHVVPVEIERVFGVDVETVATTIASQSQNDFVKTSPIERPLAIERLLQKQTASASINRLQQEACSENRDFISIKIEAILWRNCKESSHFWRFGAEVGESSGRLKVAPLGAGVEESVEEAGLALCEFEACCGAALKSERIVTRAVEVVDVLFRVERVNNLKKTHNTNVHFIQFKIKTKTVVTYSVVVVIEVFGQRVFRIEAIASLLHQHSNVFRKILNELVSFHFRCFYLFRRWGWLLHKKLLTWKKSLEH